MKIKEELIIGKTCRAGCELVELQDTQVRLPGPGYLSSVSQSSHLLSLRSTGDSDLTLSSAPLLLSALFCLGDFYSLMMTSSYSSTPAG